MRTSLNNVPRALARYVFVVGAAALSLLPAAAPSVKAGATPARRQEGADSQSAAAARQRVNVQPLRQLLPRFREILEHKGAANQTRRARVEADLAEDGSFTDVRVDAAGDREFIRFVTNAAQAVGDSRVFSLVSNQGARRVEMLLRLDGENILASASADIASAEGAQQLATGYGLLLTMARKKAEGRASFPVLSAAHLSANGKQLVLSLEMPREQLGNLLQQHVTPN